ncbi:MAG: transcriptional regulator BetI [Gammaproteobacteria bacterium]|nr:transcriptional regulator BetI [Gammaproteobacteria bacterium]
MRLRPERSCTPSTPATGSRASSSPNRGRNRTGATSRSESTARAHCVASRNGVPKFHRETAAVRRGALIAATLRSLERYGHEGASIRRISAVAGVSIGLINHHFRTKSELIAAAYESLALGLQRTLRLRAAADRDTPPRERISRFLNASFGPDLLAPSVFNVWLVFWSMILHSPQMRAVHDRTYRRYRAILENLLGALDESGEARRFRLRPAAIALSALLDGLWIELSLSPGTFRPEEAIAICEDWVDALCAGAFVHLLNDKPRTVRSQPRNHT